MFNVQSIIEQLNQNNIKTYNAVSDGEDIHFENNNDNSDIENFIDLMQTLEVKVAYIHSVKLSEEAIEHNIITEDDYSSIYEDIFKKQIKEYNKELNQLKKYIDYDLQINIYFVYQGIIHSLLLTNEDLNFTLKEDFIDELKEKYELEIDNIDNEKAEKRAQETSQYLDKLRDFLMSSEEFKKCTNKSLRRNYVDGIRYGMYPEHEDMIHRTHIISSYLDNVIEQAWTKVKLTMKR